MTDIVSNRGNIFSVTVDSNFDKLFDFPVMMVGDGDTTSAVVNGPPPQSPMTAHGATGDAWAL
ncbi:hypothetical protein BD779DRAFT_1065933 [Infundibulicybe gibba]|nr:hypothetical protein BD779DRAFT_1065933 [Infundibulicybe gibba]